MNADMSADMSAVMAADSGAAGQPASYALPTELTIFSVAETRDGLLAWLARAGEASDATDTPLQVDASGVADVDGAGVQLLCALDHLIARDDRHWQLLDPSGALSRACQVLGLGDWLALHAVGV